MLDFLKDISLDESEIIKAAKSKGTGGGRKKDWNPTYANTIRIWKDGSVFPSADLVELFDLEYKARPIVAADAPDLDENGKKIEKWIQPGNAFDVFDSAEFPAFKSPQRFIIANVVGKGAGKADLFASVTWDALTGEPENSVMDQGANTFGKSDFLGLLKDIYGIELSDDLPYADLVLLDSKGELKDTPPQPFKLVGDKKIAFVPKKVSRGDAKGSLTVVRREDPWLFVLYPLVKIHPEMGYKKPEPKPEKAPKAKLSVDTEVADQKEAGAEPAVDESPFIEDKP